MTNNIQKIISQRIARFAPEVKSKSVGRILSLGDGVATISGLDEAMMSEILEFPQKTFGLVLNLERHYVGAIILGDYRHLREGDEVSTTGKVLQIPVGEALIGRIVNPLGVAIDGQSAPKTTAFNPLEKIASGVITREKVNQPVQTGIAAVDSMIPIGRGQRELIIGDRSTGKSAIALTTVINQKNKKLICIYVVIGQKAAFTAQLVDTLKKFNALDHTIIVAATAADSPALQYLAPYSGMAVAEYFCQKGQDALVVFDDLSKHAWAYRELSLLLRRPSGRDAYPGDIFYLHSRLLERSLKLNKTYGGGSITALPIIETQAGDVSGYIPTNIISITDGQIYLETDLFNSGIRPAINVGLSVSRVGGNAQVKAMRQVAGKLRMELSQFRELAAFAQFSSDLDPTTKAQLDRGSRITEILKQGWDDPMSVENQIMLIWAVTNGFLDKTPLEKVKSWQDEYLKYLSSTHPQIGKTVAQEKTLSDKLIKELTKITGRFNASHQDLVPLEESESDL
ncbi:MAG: F0F1 ATP synthase subunit alpha [Candidatus Beckwithbacteria bacterium]|nr:F0F1 ATP synthase subunit alpha [Candidatus Beckwithbacteria bacterium]